MKTSSKTPDTDRWRELINRHLLGNISTEESVELEAFLSVSREAREDFRSRCNIDTALRQQAFNQGESADTAKNKMTRVWFSPTLTSAAAGLAFGMFCTSVAWAYVGPYAGKAVTLLQESFESGTPPLNTGMPLKQGLWSGDYTEVVGEQRSVRPTNGVKMLRFLRGDYEGKPKPEGSYISDLYQLIDLRSHRNEIGDGGALVQLSAKVNTFPFPKEESYDCSAGIYALSAKMVADGTHHNDIALTNGSLAMGRKSLPNLDRDPRTWQKFDCELRLPPDTEFLLIRIGMLHGSKDQRDITFDGHYLDDVRLSLARRPPLP